MRASAVAAFVVALALAPGARAADQKEIDYAGWQIIASGVEITTATVHYSDGTSRSDDKCTVIKRGTSRYVVTKNPWGKGVESFSMDKVSASTTITVNGGGSASPSGARWFYKLGPAPYPSDEESFCPSNGGAPRSSPDEPMFLPRSISPHSDVPVVEWGTTAEGSQQRGAAEEVASSVWSDVGYRRPDPLEYVFPHRLDAQHLTASGHRTFALEWPGPPTHSTCTIEVSYNVVVIPTPGNHRPPKVELDEIDRTWWPEGNNSVNAHITVHGGKPAQAFRLTLYDVSKEPGTCCNSGDANTDPDLSFAPDAGGWSVEARDSQWIATSDNGGTDATVKIACHDWGAWGKLKGEAKIGDHWEAAQVAGSALSFVRIPYDDDDDHLADSWQGLYGVAGKAAKDDSGKKPKDQANDGDGLSVYEDYRGLSVLGEDGGMTHVRLDPRQKVLFVLDKSNYFDPGQWEKCSGIKGYLLNDAMCKPIAAWPDGARRVNFRSSYARNGDKYCVVITPVKGFYKDPDGDVPVGLANGPAGGCPESPREVESLYLYPDNAISWVNTFATRLGIAAAQPDSAEAKEFDQLGLPRMMWRDASNKLSEGYRQQLADQMMRVTAIHEMGHACGLMGHIDEGKKEVATGNKSCPMCYSDHTDDLKYMILQVLLKPDAPLGMAYGQFCRDADFNCWGHLNVKDN